MLPFAKSAVALRLSNSSQSVQYKHLHSKHLSFSSSSFSLPNPKVIKKENVFYSLHKIFIITTERTIVDNILSNRHEMAFTFYYPIKPVNSLHYLIRFANLHKDKDHHGDIALCSSLKDICVEICNFATLDTDRCSYKINIYDKEYRPIINDVQLTLYPPLSELYAKVKVIYNDVRDMHSISDDNVHNNGNSNNNSEWSSIQRNSFQKQTANCSSLKLTSHLCSLKKFLYKPQCDQNHRSALKDSSSNNMHSGCTSRDYSVKSSSQKNLFRKKVLMYRRSYSECHREET